MTVIFPKNNLPESAQPWAREVQKQLTSVIASDRANEINNAARDNQLNSSLISLTKVVSDVKVASDEATAAINGLIGLGSAGSSYTINASNINAGTINASIVTVTNIDATNITTGRIVGGSSTATLDFESFDGSSYFQVWNDNARMRGGSATIQCSGSTILLASAVSALSSITASGNYRGPGITATTFLQSENYAGGGTTGASINNNGTIIRTSSSERYKQDIEDLQVSYEDILALQPKRFRLKDEAAENPDARYYAGFIAEEIDQTSLKDFVAYETLPDGTKRPDGVYYGELTSALLEAIKHQDSIIKSLTSRIEALENRVE